MKKYFKEKGSVSKILFGLQADGALRSEQLKDFERALNDLRRALSSCERKKVNAAISKLASRIVAMSFCEPRSWTRVLSS